MASESARSTSGAEVLSRPITAAPSSISPRFVATLAAVPAGANWAGCGSGTTAANRAFALRASIQGACHGKIDGSPSGKIPRPAQGAGEDRPQMVAARDAGEQCARPQARRLHPEQSTENCRIADALRAGEQATQSGTLSLGALNAHLLHKPRRQNPSSQPQEKADAGQRGTARTVWQAISRIAASDQRSVIAGIISP